MNSHTISNDDVREFCCCEWPECNNRPVQTNSQCVWVCKMHHYSVHTRIRVANSIRPHLYAVFTTSSQSNRRCAPYLNATKHICTDKTYEIIIKVDAEGITDRISGFKVLYRISTTVFMIYTFTWRFISFKTIALRA